MKEKVVWVEVDAKDVPNEYDLEDYKFSQTTHKTRLWLKRVVIPILSDQEIKDLGNKIRYSFFNHFSWEKGYKAKQEELINIK